MPREIGIGVIGFGWMGHAHARSYRSIPAYFPEARIRPRLVAVADTDPARVKDAVANHGFEAGTADYREMLDRDDIEIIDITAPNGMHEELATAAAAAGKHVFCEKPVGVDPGATARIEAATRRAGVITGGGYNYRWVPLVQYLRGLIAEGRLGELTHYRGRFFTMYGRDRLGLLNWRFLLDDGGYGVLNDVMPHVIDMAQHLCGPITRVTSVKEIFVKQRPLPRPEATTHYERGAPDDPTGEVTNEDYVGALVEFANGVRGTLEVDRSIFGPQSSMAFELNGSRGAASWDHEKLNQLQLYLPEEQPTDGFIEVLAGDSLPHHGNLVPGAGNSIGYEDLKIIEALEFCRAVAEERPYEADFEAALSNASVAAAMIRSWESGRWEDVVSLRIEDGEG